MGKKKTPQLPLQQHELEKLPKHTTATIYGRLKLPTQEQTSRKNHEMRDSRAQREDVLSLSLSQGASVRARPSPTAQNTRPT